MVLRGTEIIRVVALDYDAGLSSAFSPCTTSVLCKSVCLSLFTVLTNMSEGCFLIYVGTKLYI